MFDQASKYIPLAEPLFNGNEWKYVKDCFDTGWVSSSGSYVVQFEKMVADYVETKHAVATVNGTCALHVSLIACGVKHADEVIVPTLTFIAPVNAVRYCQAYPVFMDCDLRTLCLDVQKLADFLENECEKRGDGFTYNKTSNRRIKAIIPVHVFGYPADMDSLLGYCNKFNIDIIEDATESLGSEYKGEKTGSFGKIGCFSFNGNKIITTGGGGMVVTNDEIIAERIRHLTTQAKCDPFEYNHDEIGYNYRLTNIQAALGVAQMEQLEKFISIKRRNASLYRELLRKVNEVEFIWEDDQIKSNFWFYTIRVSKEHRNSLIKYLLSRNVIVRPIWKPINTLPMYKGYQACSVENAVNVYESCINLPCSTSLKREEIIRVVDTINDYFRRYEG